MPNNLFTKGHALIIGAGDDLAKTVKDATELYRLFTDPKLAGYPANQTKLLVEEGANRENILNSLDNLKEINDANECTVFVYYSGHGGYVKKRGNMQEDGYYLSANGCNGTKETCILEREFIQKINAIHAKKLVVILDCCYAQGVAGTKAIVRAGSPIRVSAKKTENSNRSVNDLVRELSQGEGRVIIAASKKNQKSYIGDIYSVFTECLLEALGGKVAREEDKYIRILPVLEYLLNEVPKRTNDENRFKEGPQEPLIPQMTNMDNFPICLAPQNHKDSLRAETETTSQEKPKAISSTNQALIKIYEKSKQTNIEKMQEFVEEMEEMPVGPQKRYLKKQIENIEKEVAKLEAKINDLSK